MGGVRKHDDIALVERFKLGDRSAFDELVLRHQDSIYNLCRRMLGNAHDAEDAAQDAFLKAYRHLPEFQPDAAFATWLYRIAVNTCLDRTRKPVFASLFHRSGEGYEIMYDAPSPDPSPERLVEAKQLDRSLWRSLGRLSPKLRTVLILKEVEGLSYEEIAEVLDISLGTVKSRISRARDEVQELMQEF